MTVGDPVRVVAPTIVRITYKHVHTNGKAIDNVVDISLDEFGVARDAAVAVMVGRVNKPWQQHMLQLMANNITFTGCAWIDLDRLDGTAGFQSPDGSASTTGALTVASLPPNSALLVRKNTAAVRGERQGRMFIAGPPEDSIGEDGAVTGAFATNSNNELAQYLSAIQSLPGTPALATTAVRVVHVHKHDSDDPADWDWSSSTVNSLVLDAKIATQRRRLR